MLRKGDIATSFHFLLDMVKCCKTCNYDVLNRHIHQIAKDKRISEPRFKRSIPDLWFLIVSIHVCIKFVELIYVIHSMNIRHLLFTRYLNKTLIIEDKNWLVRNIHCWNVLGNGLLAGKNN